MNTAHLSATVSHETKTLVENYSHKSGIKKLLCEDALLHHLQAHLDAEPTPELTALMQNVV